VQTADLEQNTQEWKEARLGHVTASGIHDLLSKPRKRGQEESSGRRNYKAKLALEIISGKLSKEGDIETWWMKRGKELEGDARTEYEIRTGFPVTQCGFLTHPEIERFGCSPDGLVGEDGMTQIKCLNRANHIECLTSGIPSDHEEQMICELAVCVDKKWNDFASYHPEFPGDLKLYVKRIHRKDVLPQIEAIQKAVIEFNKEVDAVVLAMRTRANLGGQLEASIHQVGRGAQQV
jgi:hypothetical protein